MYPSEGFKEMSNSNSDIMSCVRTILNFQKLGASTPISVWRKKGLKIKLQSTQFHIFLVRGQGSNLDIKFKAVCTLQEYIISPPLRLPKKPGTKSADDEVKIENVIQNTGGQTFKNSSVFFKLGIQKLVGISFPWTVEKKKKVSPGPRKRKECEGILTPRESNASDCETGFTGKICTSKNPATSNLRSNCKEIGEK